MYKVRPESHVLAGLLGPGSVARARHCSGCRKEQPVASILWEAKARPRPLFLNQEASGLAAMKMLANRSIWQQSSPRLKSKPAWGANEKLKA